MKATNLNPLFIDQVANFAHLVTVEPQSKAQFMQTIERAYDRSNPKINLFYLSVEKSDFETIRLNDTRDAILFNQ